MQQLSTLFLSSGDLIADRRFAWAQDQESKGDLAGAEAAMKRCEEMSRNPRICKSPVAAKA